MSEAYVRMLSASSQRWGYSYYRDPQGRRVSVVLWEDRFCAEVVAEGDVVAMYEGSQAGLPGFAELHGWTLETERVTG